ncbi:MAG: hypothetical protein IE928_10680 [Gammaproteobacteria bacterium]|nr:hypothetical protein [Gammaproteobacteria bacterium]
MSAPQYIKKIKYKLILPLISRLPRKSAFTLATKLGRRFFWLFEPEWIESYRAGLKLAFREATHEQVEQWVYAHFGMMAREELDVFYLTRMNRKTITDMASLNADALIKERNNCGKIIVMAHAGRPIMLSSALGLSDLSIGMLSQVIDERNPHLDEQTRDYLQYKMHHTVRIAGGRWVTTADHLRVLYDALKQGETIIIMMDLVEADPARQVKVDFLNGQLALPPGIIRLVQRSGAKLFYGRALDSHEQTVCSVIALPDDPVLAMQAAAQQLENDINIAPWQWWQWNNLPLMWSRTS